jgi:hypothetical protein
MPSHVTDSGKTTVWRRDHGETWIDTNPVFYRLQGMVEQDEPASKRRRGKAFLAPVKELEKHVFPPLQLPSHAQPQNSKRRGQAAKRYRKPPMRKT